MEITQFNTGGRSWVVCAGSETKRRSDAGMTIGMSAGRVVASAKGSAGSVPITQYRTCLWAKEQSVCHGPPQGCISRWHIRNVKISYGFLWQEAGCRNRCVGCLIRGRRVGMQRYYCICHRCDPIWIYLQCVRSSQQNYGGASFLLRISALILGCFHFFLESFTGHFL